MASYSGLANKAEIKGKWQKLSYISFKDKFS